MFGKLFTESGLSLDRLRVLVEVGANGSIVRAAGGDPVRQSQYSRQLKELEDFFQVALVERHGKNLRLTPGGKELARISRFFLLGLSNFQRGCLAGGQTYRLGATATFSQLFLLPVLDAVRKESGISFIVETLGPAEVERRLHDLTLDFGVVTETNLGRPLQVRELGQWGLKLWVPKALFKTAKQAGEALLAGDLALAWPAAELEMTRIPALEHCEPPLVCSSFVEARTLLAGGSLAAFLPDYFDLGADVKRCHCLSTIATKPLVFRDHLAWNPRLLRLNPHTHYQRDVLIAKLSQMMSSQAQHRARSSH